MRNILLLAPTVIDGAVRYPVEGPIPVTDEKAAQLIEDKVTESADLDDEEDGDDLDGKTVKQLKVIATAEEVNLDGKTDQAGIVAAIREHRAATAAPQE